jgi:serine/threonine-protein kinase HipA
MDIGGEGRRPTRAHVTGLGEKHSYNAKQIAVVIEEVRAAVADWPKFATQSGVTAASAKAIGQAHAQVRADFEEK